MLSYHVVIAPRIHKFSKLYPLSRETLVHKNIMNTISSNERAGRHVRFNAIMPTYTSGQLEDINAVCDLGRVVEDAVERNSWGKSRSDWMCHFPNTGGLHHTSGDAPFETQNFTHDNSTESSHIATTAFYANSNINWQMGQQLANTAVCQYNNYFDSYPYSQ